MIGLGLALLSNAALALGLGEIKVKSQPGQPLLAEIPIISSDQGELEQLRARLASPTTFERVGLPRPQGLVNELDFSVALDEAGRPVVRVTSRTPVDVAAAEPTGSLAPLVEWLVTALGGAVAGLVVGGIIVLIVRRFHKHPEELIVD